MEDNENHQIYDSLGSMTFSGSPKLEPLGSMKATSSEAHQ
jgi:hypothetical protein